MEGWQRRAANTIVAVVALIFVSSVLYHYVMTVFEGRSPSYYHSLQVVIETYTGTGYGSDSGWETPVGNLFVSVLDLGTFLILFIVVPYVFRPVLEEALSPTVPRSTDLERHVVMCGYSQRGERLVEEFHARGAGYVVVVEDDETALALDDDGVSVVQGDPSAVEALGRANAEAASAVVVDTDDDESASTILAIRELNDDARIVVLVEDLSLERHLEYAGADRVMTPRHLLGQRIAERIETEFKPGLSDVKSLGTDFALVELTVFEDSPICGETIAETGLDGDPNLSIVGLWKDGEFVRSPSPAVRIDETTVLLVAGRERALNELEKRAYSTIEPNARVIVAGSGEVGSTVHARLRSAGIDCTVVDVEDKPGVDVLGDATEEETLRRAGVETATTFVVAIGDDDQAILSVLIARELVADLDVIVRVNHSESEQKIRRAGGDYVLSLPDISGRILALDVLREDVLSYDRQLKVVRVDASAFAGSALSETAIAETDTIVVGIERAGEVIVDVSADLELVADDNLLVAGSDEAIDELKSKFE